jgi:hypothetical protein
VFAGINSASEQEINSEVKVSGDVGREGLEVSWCSLHATWPRR